MQKYKCPKFKRYLKVLVNCYWHELDVLVVILSHLKSFVNICMSFTYFFYMIILEI